MQRKSCIRIMGIAFVILLIAGYACAFSIEPVTDFSDWYEVEQLGQWTSGYGSTSVTTSNSGNLWYGADAVGIMATININSLVGYGAAGLGMHLGTLGAYRVHVNISVVKNSSVSAINYQIRLKDSDNNFVQDVASGRFGGSAESIIGNDVSVGFFRVGNVITFIVPGYSVIRWSPERGQQMGAQEKGVWLWGWADQSIASNISATFKNVRIFYP